MPVYVVSSLFDYAEGEVYFGAEGVFKTIKEAVLCTEKSVAETLTEYQKHYVTQLHAQKYGEYRWRIAFAGHLFEWRIDTFEV